MANRRSAIKKIRTDKKRRIMNLRVVSEIRTVVRRLNAFITSKKVAEAVKEARLLFSKLDKAVKKGVLHKNRASRRKSRLQLRLNNLKA